MSSATQNEITATALARKRTRFDANPPTDSTVIGQKGRFPSANSLIGTKLVPIRFIVASQPNELRNLIIERSSMMLSQRFDRLNREKSLQKFTSSSGDKTYRPPSCRHKQPIKSSQTFQDEPTMKEIIEEAEAHHEAYLDGLAEICEKMAKEELRLNEMKAMTTLFTSIQIIAENLIIIKKLEDGVDKWKSKLSVRDQAIIAGHDFLTVQIADDPQYEGLTSGHHTAEAFLSHHGTSFVIMDHNRSEQDKQLGSAISLILKPIITAITVDLWSWHEKKDLERKIASELKANNEIGKQEQANQDVEMAMEKEAEHPTQVKAMIEQARKATADEFKKEIQSLKTMMRKNGLGGSKDQASQPSDNGRNKSKGSRKSKVNFTNRSNLTPPPKSILKNRPPQAAKPTKPKPSGKASRNGSQGDARNEKQKGKKKKN